MIKSASLISAALLVFGLAAGSMTADVARAAAPTADDAGARASDAPKATHKHKSSHKSSHKSHKASHKSKKTERTGQ